MEIIKVWKVGEFVNPKDQEFFLARVEEVRWSDEIQNYEVKLKFLRWFDDPSFDEGWNQEKAEAHWWDQDELEVP